MKHNRIFALCLSLAFLGACSTAESSSSPSASEPASESSSEPTSESSSEPSSEAARLDNTTFWNPLEVYNVSGAEYKTEVCDPGVAYDPINKLFYCVSTSSTNGPLLSYSEDGCVWTVKGAAFDRPTWGDAIAGTGCSVWAPDIAYIDGQWVIYYSLSAWGAPAGVGVAVAEDPMGEWTDLGKLFSCDDIGISNCIDPFVFVDDDGSVYIGAGSFYGIFLTELDETGTSLLVDEAYANENKIQIAGYNSGSWDGSMYEGGYIFKRDGQYIFMGSAGTCCSGSSSTYRVYAGIADEIAGPYLDASGNDLAKSGGGTTYGELVIAAEDSSDKPVYGPGHNSVVVDPSGDAWMYYHGYTESDNFATRHLLLDKLEFDENGYPYVDTDGERVPSYGVELDGPKYYL